MSRELDAEVEHVVFGRVPQPCRIKGEANTVLVYHDGANPQDGIWTIDELWQHWGPREFSTSIAVAFEVVEKMRERGWDVHLIGEANHLWDCMIFKDGLSKPLAREGADSPAHAISLAALAAVKAQEGGR